MTRKKDLVKCHIDRGQVRSLTRQEIKAILRGADELIATGGRSMLAKILKGSQDKKVLEHGLDQCPVYGFYRELTLADITSRVDWMIENDYLEIAYSGKLPVIIFTPQGWEIERENYAEELLQKLTHSWTIRTTALSMI
jgi:superfamily II DNA helicase RecQ